MAKTCVVCSHEARNAIETAMAAGTPYRDLESQFGPSRSALSRHLVCKDREERKAAKEAELDWTQSKKGTPGPPPALIAPVVTPAAPPLVAPEVYDIVELPHAAAPVAPVAPAVRAGSRKTPIGIDTPDDLFRVLDKRNQGRVSRLQADAAWDRWQAEGWPTGNQIGPTFDSMYGLAASTPAPRPPRPPAPPPPEREREPAWPRLPKPGNTAAVAEIQRRTRPHVDPAAPARDVAFVSDLLRDDGERPHDRPAPRVRSIAQGLGTLF